VSSLWGIAELVLLAYACVLIYRLFRDRDRDN
jgi:hypothetical protein